MVQVLNMQSVYRALSRLSGWFLVALLPSVSTAYTYGQFGVAVDHPANKSYSAVKYVEFGHRDEYKRCAYKLGVGGWADTTKYKKKDSKGIVWTADNSLYFHALVGVEPRSEHFYMGYRVGPAIITNPDALLGSWWQVSQELSFGMRDEREVRVGMAIKHFSNAGLTEINMGRKLHWT
jgi:hypothetical protein